MNRVIMISIISRMLAEAVLMEYLEKQKLRK